MPEGGTLTLTTSHPHGGSASGPVRLEVVDSGMGMDEETRRQCLEPFFTTKGERGTGLGLAMVYGVVKRHGAEIEIESAPGQGTTMRVDFSAAVGGLGPTQATPARPVPARLRILVVDDDPLLLKSLRDTLESDGHLITTANDGRAGIEAFRAAVGRAGTFAVVITDLGMPYVDGRKVAAAIKEMSPSTPVIMLTGWGQRLVADGDVPPHVDQILSKPPRLRDLRDAFARHCGPADTEGPKA
jgi:CheY-like chemotaxis protein